jgi:hypothetical protein
MATKKKKPENIKHWLTDEEYEKTVGQLRIQINGVLGLHFNKYGQGAYIPIVSSIIVELAEKFGMRVRGEDIPLRVPFRDPEGELYNADD